MRISSPSITLASTSSRLTANGPVVSAIPSSSRRERHLRVQSLVLVVATVPREPLAGAAAGGGPHRVRRRRILQQPHDRRAQGAPVLPLDEDAGGAVFDGFGE